MHGEIVTLRADLTSLFSIACNSQEISEHESDVPCPALHDDVTSSRWTPQATTPSPGFTDAGRNETDATTGPRLPRTMVETVLCCPRGLLHRSRGVFQSVCYAQERKNAERSFQDGQELRTRLDCRRNPDFLCVHGHLSVLLQEKMHNG